ncbi:MAG: PQQ-binding-like beta-propeller repeat protein [Pirellulales bacterium]|nr:PQQ-binding-like beta-propeller repeat protein [Pirellulales bacterium]
MTQKSAPTCSRVSSTLLLLLTTIPMLGADWLEFRGNANQSIASGSTYPLKWSAQENVAWKSPLPGAGVSGPIVIGNRVVITASSGIKDDRLHVMCFKTSDGSLLWERRFWATGRTLHHPTSSVAAPTPASDGESIFAFYSSNDLICLDLEGNLRWLRGLTHDYPTAANDVGMASSPLVVGNTVIVQCQSQGESFAAGINKKDGTDLWRHDLTKTACWTSPTLFRAPAENGASTDVVLIQSPDRTTAHDPASGKILWSYDASCQSIASSCSADGIVYLPADGLTALKPAAKDGAVEVLWKSNRLGPYAGSPVFDRDLIYVINRSGVLACADDKSDMKWQARLKGTFWATPVLAGDHMYCVNQDGLTLVVKLGEKGEVVAENELGDSVLGSPALVDGAIYLRGVGHLWKIADATQASK